VPRILVRLLEDRQSRVLPEAKRAQTEVELRLRAVETLQVQGKLTHLIYFQSTHFGFDKEIVRVFYTQKKIIRTMLENRYKQ
jgi:hypothetical protein